MWDWFVNFLTTILEGIQGVVGDWGLAVIILTFIVRLLLTPLMNSSTKSNARLQIVQPKMKEIQEKYADDPQRQSQELQKIYSEMNVNPLGGCLPLLLQMPIFFALFSVVKSVPESASFYVILPSIAKSASEVLSESGWLAAAPYIIFDLLFGALTFIPMVTNTSLTTDESQRKQTLTMGAVMSLMMLWFGWSVPSAVLLYYVTSSTWQVIQMKLITNKVLEKAKKEAEEKLANQPVVVDVVRREKKKKPKAGGKKKV